MQFFDGVTYALKRAGLGLDDKQPFCGSLHFALPAIHGLDLRDNVHTSCKAAFHEGVSNLPGLFLRSCGCKHNADVTHGRSSAVSVSIERSALSCQHSVPELYPGMKTICVLVIAEPE